MTSRCHDCEQSTSSKCWRHTPGVQVGPNATATGEMTLSKQEQDPVVLARDIWAEWERADWVAGSLPGPTARLARAVLDMAREMTGRAEASAKNRTWRDGRIANLESQLDAARAEVERLRPWRELGVNVGKALALHGHDMGELLPAVERLCMALAWYANENNYPAQIEDDAGERARAALGEELKRPCPMCERLEAALAVAKGEIQGLATALTRYGKHDESCGYWKKENCSCGLWSALPVEDVEVECLRLEDTDNEDGREDGP